MALKAIDNSLDEKLCLFYSKQANLDFTREPGFADTWQQCLDAIYGVLFAPYVATEIADAFLESRNPMQIRLGKETMLHVALLHPDYVHPSIALSLSLEDFTGPAGEYLAHPYSIGRLLANAVVEDYVPAERKEIERVILEPYVKDFHIEVYEAIIDGDHDRLCATKETILNEEGTKMFCAWWELFFLNYS